MSETQDAIIKAYQVQVMKLYEILSNDIVYTEGDESHIKEAEKRFKKGLSHAADVKSRALEASTD